MVAEADPWLCGLNTVPVVPSAEQGVTALPATGLPVATTLLPVTAALLAAAPLQLAKLPHTLCLTHVRSSGPARHA